MKHDKIYISAPITGRDLDERRAYFADAAKQLKRLGYTAVNPMSRVPDPTLTHEEYMRADLALMLRCDGYIQAYDAIGSRGCELEEQVADGCGIRLVGVITRRGEVKLLRSEQYRKIKEEGL